jgi:hypothetical protein
MEVGMKRLFLCCVAGLFVMAPVYALAQGASGSKPAATKKMLSASGTVSAITATSVTVKGKTAEWTFVVDNDTKVTGSGASHKSDALKDEKKPSVITEFVKVGDTVAVKYHDLGDTKHAADVRVTRSKPAAK